MPRRPTIAARVRPPTVGRFRRCLALGRALGLDADATLAAALGNAQRRLMVRCRREGIDPLAALNQSRPRKGEPPPFDPSVLERCPQVFGLRL